MANRKIIQVAIDPTGEDGELACVYAVCNDGTLWVRPASGLATWRRIPNIPQEKINA